MPNIKKTAPLLDRRNLLKLTAASASTVAGIWWPGASWGQAKINSNPFTLGIASGSPTTDGIVLWTRLLPSGFFSSIGNENASVRWEIAHDAKFQRIAQQGTSLATPQLGHSVHVLAQ